MKGMHDKPQLLCVKTFAFYSLRDADLLTMVEQAGSDSQPTQREANMP